MMIGTILLGAVIILQLVLLIVSQNQGGRSKKTAAELNERIDTTLRSQFETSRRETATSARDLREEVQVSLAKLGQNLAERAAEQTHSFDLHLGHFTEQLQQLSDWQRERFETFAKTLGDSAEGMDKRLEALRQENADATLRNRQELDHAMKQFRDAFLDQAKDSERLQRERLEAVTTELTKLTGSMKEDSERLRTTVDDWLKRIQTDNARRLEEMRVTVDEKLHKTLEQRLGESFKLVSERLEQVHKGLGEMQSLAAGVGDLKKVLMNVKTRGTLGEIQLGSLLEQILSPEQYSANVYPVPQSRAVVEYAVKMPGDGSQPVWLPIDAKFPTEDYECLLNAYEAGDNAQIEKSRKNLEQRIKSCAKDIREKYILPPYTTDVGFLFLPIEGLMAEVLRIPGLFELLQREYHVIVTGPTTLTAILNGLKMGFHTVAISQRSSEVWKVLGAVKSEFGKFGEVISKTRDKMVSAVNEFEKVDTRTRVLQRKLRDVETLPGNELDALTESDE